MNSYFLVSAGVGVGTTYSDRSPRPKMPLAGFQMVAPPTAQFIDFKMGWLPTYTDRTPTHVPVRPARIGVTNIFISGIAPTGWLPTYPTYRAVPRVHRVFYQSVFDPQSGAEMRVAQSMTWDPKQKAPFITRPKIARTQFAYSTEARIAVGGNLCVELVDTSFTVPTFTVQVVEVPTFLSETLARPSFINEDLC